ncbi:hypothetical protein FDUTEX481_07498 [Tolypothrix sp. PCC 7601]|nr:hypothetical protein FDUTEX481_07498 [Tolypothrix sp. PCC 7601]
MPLQSVAFFFKIGIISLFPFPFFPLTDKYCVQSVFQERRSHLIKASVAP